MKINAAVLFLCLTAALPVAASAQATPAAPAPSVQPQMPRPNMQAMRAFREQEETLHKQARAKILGSLSSAHRQYVATIVGQLAIAASPDPKAAAAKIDARLSASEKNAVQAAQQSYRDNEKALRDNMRTEFESQMTPEQKAQMQARMQSSPRPRRSPRPMSAGSIVLGAAVGGMFGEHGGFGGPMMFGRGSCEGCGGHGGNRRGGMPPPAPTPTP